MMAPLQNILNIEIGNGRGSLRATKLERSPQGTPTRRSAATPEDGAEDGSGVFDVGMAVLSFPKIKSELRSTGLPRQDKRLPAAAPARPPARRLPPTAHASPRGRLTARRHGAPQHTTRHAAAERHEVADVRGAHALAFWRHFRAGRGAGRGGRDSDADRRLDTVTWRLRVGAGRGKSRAWVRRAAWTTYRSSAP